MTDLATASPPPSPPQGGAGIVVARDLRKTFHISRPPREVLHGVSLTVTRGEFVAIMGPSGCGKSTLLHILGGLEPPDEGTVVIEGEDLYSRDDEWLTAYRRDHMGFVFQLFNLIPTLTAAQNIELPLRFRRPAPKREDIRARTGALMDALDLHRLQGHGPEEISGGEQQRVAIARALAAQPTVVLADEPTGNLDWHTSREVMGLLARLCREEQQTTVLVTHDARTAAYADRVLVMRDGAVIAEQPLQPTGDDPTAPRDAAPLIARLVELGL